MTNKVVELFDFETIKRGESRDCVVRAFSVGLNISYELSHRYCKEVYSRKNRRGVIDFLNKQDQDTFLGKYCYKEYYSKSNRPTVGQFIKNNPHGTYIVSVRGHAFVIEDGKVLDFNDGLKRKVLFVAKVLQSPKEQDIVNYLDEIGENYGI